MAQSFISEDRERFTIVCEEFIKKTYRLYRIYYTCSGTHLKSNTAMLQAGPNIFHI